MENNFPNRKKLRLAHFDYSKAGAYFLTICTHNRQNTLSHVGAIHESPEPKLTEFGKIARDVLSHIPERFGIMIDRYVIMPNHIHLIVFIMPGERAIHESPLQGRSLLSKTVGFFKMNTSKEIHSRYGNIAVWQRGFNDHIIRDPQDYATHAQYIAENPVRWYYDELYSVP